MADATGDPVPRPDGRAEPRDSLPLAEEEVLAVLERSWWGVLATSVDGRPYAVPVAYGFDGRGFYVAAREGRKVRNVDANPNVCLTVAEVEPGGADWASVVALGTAARVTGVRRRLAALAALRRQCGRGARPTREDLRRVRGAVFLYIEPEELTGRRKHPHGPRRGEES